jgi:exodeoxyribonuclease VII small subunit
VAKSKPKQQIDDWNYEATVDRIEEILEAIERGDLELAEVFSQFALSVDYLDRCESFLAQQQERVELLIETLGDRDAPVERLHQKAAEWEIDRLSPRPPLI